jgi:hypothetical protein
MLLDPCLVRRSATSKLVRSTAGLTAKLYTTVNAGRECEMNSPAADRFGGGKVYKPASRNLGKSITVAATVLRNAFDGMRVANL